MPLDEYINYGTLPLIIEERPQAAGIGEYDSVELDVLVACVAMPGWRAAAHAAGYVENAPLPGYAGFFTRALSASQEAGKALVTVSAVGTWEGAEKRKRTMTCAGQQISVGPNEKVILAWSTQEQAKDPVNPSATVLPKRRIPKTDDDGEIEYKTIATPSGTNTRWNINSPIVTLSDVYFTTTRPAMTAVGNAFTPSNAPTPPPWIWSGYTEPMRANHPSGWVLDNREVEELIAGAFFQVTDSPAYYYPAMPD